MSSLLDKLNMQPGERRLVVGIALILFIVLNVWLVWPHLKDWKSLYARLEDGKSTLRRYKTLIARMPEFEEKLSGLKKAGSDLKSEAQALQLQRTVDTQARQSGVLIGNYDSRQAARSGVLQTNEFFDEQTLRITITTGEKELIDFLYNIGTDKSMTRVRDLDIKPELPQQQKLIGNITLTASYQKTTNAPAAGSSSTAKKP